MNHDYPIYTVETECQDCYKCVRHCPVKAIRVEEGHAMVLPELCVACGTCVRVCPAHAKRIREDAGRLKRLLGESRPVYLSLAPSWVSEFPGLDPARMAAAARLLGFAGTSETALGAQEVSADLAARLPKGGNGIHLSSACPVVVAYVEKYTPQFAAAITPVCSPVIAHARLLRRVFGNDTAIVFAGPCIAKKNEADAHRELLDLALTFADLRGCFDAMKIDPFTLRPGPQDVFVPETAEEGALYPVEGGMIRSITAQAGLDGVRFITVSGLDAIRTSLETLEPEAIREPVFVECLACPGGCINGPTHRNAESDVLRRLHVEHVVRIPKPLSRVPRVDVSGVFGAAPVSRTEQSEDRLREALRQVGKISPEDELNCSGCGYESCREFAMALVGHKAEPTMCVSYMRKLAQKKANALLRCIPSGVVLVNNELRILESNERFAAMFDPDNMDRYDEFPALRYCNIRKLVPFAHLFELALDTGKEHHRAHVHVEKALYDVTVFTIESHAVVGAVIQDVTKEELRRDEIAQRANEVIKKNLSTVQEIACRLGEHMAETELLLRSIAEGYGGGEVKNATWHEVETDD